MTAKIYALVPAMGLATVSAPGPRVSATGPIRRTSAIRESLSWNQAIPSAPAQRGAAARGDRIHGRLGKLVRTTTPVDLHYERSHSGNPDLDPASH
jgi:hypothetical protein